MEDSGSEARANLPLKKRKGLVSHDTLPENLVGAIKKAINEYVVSRAVVNTMTVMPRIKALIQLSGYGDLLKVGLCSLAFDTLHTSAATLFICVTTVCCSVVECCAYRTTVASSLLVRNG
jgi:hypothetical protein